MDIIYQPHIDRELESLIERIYPPRVCIDNDSGGECTVVKVDSANKHGILLEMVQVLTDLDLVISKSYISSDGGWFMDVFHVTDQFGNKLTDDSLMHYIQQALCATASGDISKGKLQLHTGQRPQNASAPKTALELTGPDQLGLLSEISAALVDLGCNVTSVKAWTHNQNMACIIYVEDGAQSGPITDPIRLAHVEQQLENVVDAHEGRGEKRFVRLTASAASGTLSERRLHQMMYADRDYESCRACHGDGSGDYKNGCDGTHVSISRCEDKQYWVVNLRSTDRPKLLFDTVCVLTDMQYVVFHASIRSSGSMADQEYFIRHKERPTLERESERQKLTLCLIAAIERRVSRGLRMELQTRNREGLLSDVTQVFRENGLSIARVEIGIKGEIAVGSFYVTDSSGEEVNLNIVNVVREETGGSIVAVHKSPNRMPQDSSSNRTITKESKSSIEDHSSRVSLGSKLWSQLDRLSSSFSLIRS